MTTKSEVLKRLDELEAKVEQRLAAEKALRLQAEKALEEMKKELQEEKTRADALQRKLDGYGDLGKVLTKISLDPEIVRKIIQEEMQLQQPTSNTVLATESVPYLDVKVSKPVLTLDEGTIEGQVTVLALNGKLPQAFAFADVMKALNQEYATSPRRLTVQKALDALVGKYKVLERKVQGNQWIYLVRNDARSRTREHED
jgi:predicted RNase H-like nuclease (RuvC/YqgF family)